MEEHNSLDVTLPGNLSKDTVSCIQYSSDFLLSIQSKCNFNFPNNIDTAALNSLKKFNLIKPFSNDFILEKHRPHTKVSITKKAKVSNEPVYKQNKNSSSPKNVSSTSPRCTVVKPLSQKPHSGENVSQASFVSSDKSYYDCGLEKNPNDDLLPISDIHRTNIENVDLSVKIPQTFTYPIDECPFEKIKSDNELNILYCNARQNTNTSGGRVGPLKTGKLGARNDNVYFQSGKRAEERKSTGGGKGNVLDRNGGPALTSARSSFCSGQVKKPIKPCQPQKPKKTGVICQNCQNPLLGLINDHTYSRNGVSNIFQQYKFLKAESEPDLGNLKIFSLNVGGLKSKLISDDLEKEMLNYDIVCLSEVKMDLCDVGVLKADFDQFTIFSNIEDEYNFKPRGGIITQPYKNLHI